MTECNTRQYEFAAVKRRKVEASFSGGHISSDGGSLLLRQADRRLKLTSQISDTLPDPRRQRSCEHALLSMIRQRVYAIALGYEDLNDHQTLRKDIALQTTVESDRDLASSSTLCRLENRADHNSAWAMHQVIVEQFIRSFKKAPKKLTLDFDATDDAVHGRQEGRFFHGYYDQYCFLPLYVFCENQLLVSYLRQSNIDGAKHAWAILSLLVKRFRKQWPGVKIIIRGDSGFCRHRMMTWCDRNKVDYIIGIAKNSRLLSMSSGLMEESKNIYNETHQKQRLFKIIDYSAKSWNRKRKVIVKAEYGDKGANPRFVVTSLSGEAKELYEKGYCARGEMENRIKEQQLDLFADRTSCHDWWPNQFRLLLSSLAYILIEAIRRLALYDTDLKRACCSTIRLKLFKIGAVIISNTRRVRFLLSGSYPYQEIFLTAKRRL